MEENKYERTTLYLRKQLIYQLSFSADTYDMVYGEAPKLYVNFKNKEIGELLDELLQLDGEFLRTYNPDRMNDEIKYQYNIWSSYIMKLKKEGSLSDIPINKENINKMTKFLIMLSGINTVISNYSILDDEYISNMVVDSYIEKGKKITSSSYLIECLYKNGKLQGEMIDKVYYKFVINGVLSINEDVVEIIREHKFNQIDYDRVIDTCKNVFYKFYENIVTQNLDLKAVKKFCSKFNNIVFIPLDEETRLKIAILESNILYFWENDYIINYVKQYLNDFEKMKKILEKLISFDEWYINILLLFLDKNDVSVDDKIAILKEICTVSKDLKPIDKLFTCDYINPSDFIEVIPKGSSAFLKKFMLFYKDKLSRDELVKLGKYVIENDDYQLIYQLCSEIDKISIADFVDDILKKNGNRVDHVLAKWLTDNDKSDYIANINGFYEATYIELCHRKLDDIPVDDNYFKQIEDLCNPLFVMQMQFFITEINKIKEKYDMKLRVTQKAFGVMMGSSNPKIKKK